MTRRAAVYSPPRARCELQVDRQAVGGQWVLQDCGEVASGSLSVRLRAGEPWQAWAYCMAHARDLAEALRALGFTVVLEAVPELPVEACCGD